MNASIAVSSPAAIESTLPRWLDRELYPFSPRSFRTDVGTMRYVDEGRGRPVLVSHGTPTWSFEWRTVIRALARTHRVIAPDHLGFGLSDKPDLEGALRPEDHAARLGALVSALGLEDAILVGHDFGGPIGLGALLPRPERFTGLVLTNTWMWSLTERADVRRLSALVRSPVGRLLYKGLNASPRWILPAAYGDARALGRDVHAHYLAPFPSWSTRTAPWKLGVELAGSAAFYERLWSERDAIAERPARIVWGDKDPTFRAAELARLRTALPHAKVSHAPDSGHFTAEEAPEAIVAAVRSL